MQALMYKAASTAQKRGGVNCFALLSRQNACQAHLTEGKITAAWVSERLDALSLSLRRLTVVVLDNAPVHVKALRERQAVCQERGLFVWRRSVAYSSGDCRPTHRT